MSYQEIGSKSTYSHIGVALAPGRLSSFFVSSQNRPLSPSFSESHCLSPFLRFKEYQYLYMTWYLPALHLEHPSHLSQ